MKQASPVEGNAWLGGFHYAVPPRTIYATVEEPRLVRHIDATDPDAPAWVHIKGSAHLDRDEIKIIGRDEPSITRFAFEATGFADREALAHSWKVVQDASGNPLDALRRWAQDGDGQALVHHLEATYAHFSERPPSLVIFCYSGVSRPPGYRLCCEVPKSALDALAVDVGAGRCLAIHIAFELAPSLCDFQWAEPDDKVTHGILRMSERDEGSSHGWVKTLWWDVSSADGNLAGSQVENTAQDASSSVESGLRADERVLLLQAHENIRSLARVMQWGFVLIFVLLVFLALIR